MLVVLIPQLSYSAVFMTRPCTLSLIDLTDCKVTSSVLVGHQLLFCVSQ